MAWVSTDAIPIALSAALGVQTSICLYASRYEQRHPWTRFLHVCKDRLVPPSTRRRQTLDEMADIVLVATGALVGIAARSLAEVGDDVTLAQQRVLVLLAATDDRTMGDIAEQLAVNPSTATRVCVRLEDKKLIRRHTDVDDRRTVRVQLSARGRRLVERVMDRRRVMITEVLTAMPVAARTRLADALVEFARAAGDLPDGAWTLGWHVNDDADTAS